MFFSLGLPLPLKTSEIIAAGEDGKKTLPSPLISRQAAPALAGVTTSPSDAGDRNKRLKNHKDAG